jgi:DNA replication protein DnaC
MPTDAERPPDPRDRPAADPVCPDCGGTGWKPIEKHGLRYVERCPCWRERIRRDRLAEAHIDRRYVHCTFENFRTYNESLTQALTAARRVAENFPPHDVGLFLGGKPGVGKTHLAIAVMKRIIERTGARAVFLKAHDLLARIRDTYQSSDSTERRVLEPVLTADVLVLDDLGADRPSEWVEQMMYCISDSRYSTRRLTLFTSNYQDLDDDSDPQGLVCRIGAPMRSRLHEMCEMLELTGADYRERPPNAGPEDLRQLEFATRTRPALPTPRSGGHQARASLRADHRADLKWPGGRAGSW